MGRLLQSEACMRYIELNPVRAGMVIEPSDNPWSSYHHNALGQLCDWVVPHPEICAWVSRTKRVKLPIASYLSIIFLKNSITETREATDKTWVLGNDQFKQHIQEQLGRRVEPKSIGGHRKSKQFLANRALSFGGTASS
jgi:putative transposase